MFIAGAVFGGLSCFARPDFNLPLYAFIYLMWDHGLVSNFYLTAQDEKYRILGLMVVTWVVDFIWLVYWGPFWNSEEMKDWERGVHSWTLFWSSVGFLFKVSYDSS